jgi:uncharacterized protein DUF2505
MRFTHKLHYDAPPAQVHAMLADPAFRREVCERIRAVRHDVDVRRGKSGPGSMVVVVDQAQPTNGAPAIASKFIGDEVRIVQTETWKDAESAHLDVSIPGKPGRLVGSVHLKPERSGTLETVSGDISVNIPLVGGRLAGLIGDMLHAALDVEQRVGRDYLTRGD